MATRKTPAKKRAAGSKKRATAKKRASQRKRTARAGADSAGPRTPRAKAPRPAVAAVAPRQARAIQRTTRQSPYKMRLVIDEIRGRDVNDALSYLAFRTATHWRWKAAWLALAWTLIIAIALSRVYLGVHWISDVGAGIAAQIKHG